MRDADDVIIGQTIASANNSDDDDDLENDGSWSQTPRQLQLLCPNFPATISLHRTTTPSHLPLQHDSLLSSLLPSLSMAFCLCIFLFCRIPAFLTVFIPSMSASLGYFFPVSIPSSPYLLPDSLPHPLKWGRKEGLDEGNSFRPGLLSCLHPSTTISFLPYPN